MKTSISYKKTVPECIEHQCKLHPYALCCSLRVAGRWHSYTRLEFMDYVRRYAMLFASMPEPTLILFIKKLDIDVLTAYIGAMCAGHTPAQMSPPTIKMSEAEYERKIRHIHEITAYGAIFTDASEKVQYTNMKMGCVFTPEDLPSCANPVVTAQVEDALVQFSSGSTGLQKGVILSHRAIINHMQNYCETLRLTQDDSIVTWLPLYHDMGLIACYLLPLMCGIPLYQMDPFDWLLQPDILLRSIEEKQPTICFLPNFAYHVLTQKGKPHDLRSIRLWINCSEPARQRSHEEFLAKFPTVPPSALSVCYALAENTFAVSQTIPGHGNAPQPPPKDVLSCGKPIPGVEVKVLPSQNHDYGEIGVKSPSLFSRFLDGSIPLTDDGYYLTGDLGFIDKQGEVFITGRKKDIIIVNGKNVFPQDVEYALTTVPGVYPGRAVAFGLRNENIGSEDLIVIAERKHGEPVTELKIAIQKAVQSEIGIVPKRVEIVEHMCLVKTSSGKLSRSRNRDLYLTKELAIL